jgi:hypothetical protein
MKRILLSTAVLFVTAVSFAQKKVTDVAKFDKETIDFGKIKQSVPQKGTFVVTNVSNEPLIIEQANPTCGCTISDYTKEPIAPGKTGVINATYNAAAMGHFEKHLTVKFAGINEMKSITFTGDVLSAEDYDKAKVGSSSVAEPKLKNEVAANAPSPSPNASPKATAKKVKKTKKTMKK